VTAMQEQRVKRCTGFTNLEVDTVT
jgi:hypothetical protein